MMQASIAVNQTFRPINHSQKICVTVSPLGHAAGAHLPSQHLQGKGGQGPVSCEASRGQKRNGKRSPNYEEYIKQLAGISEGSSATSSDDETGLTRLGTLQTVEPEPEPSTSSQQDEDFWSIEKERVYLVGVNVKSESRSRYSYNVHESLEELGRLADTAGLKVVGSSYQALEVPNPATYIGGGKVMQVAQAVQAYNIETVIFDDELSPGQLRNLEKAFNAAVGDGRSVRVGDRTALILDIFQQRAATREGQLQVELASVEYQLPRLTRMWSHLDRVGGGGLVKGTGEKQIEIDKRLLRDKASQLRKELEAVRTHRRLYRGRRAEAPVPVVAIVGYTNAGKSTLLNTVTGAGVLAEDKLFATLDPTTRRVRLRAGGDVLMSDTVGFIQKLPTQLVAAFRATLEEIKDASVILHVVDISHENAAGQCEAVLQVLDELEVSGIPVVTSWNKIDACANPAEVRAIASRRKDTVCISGQTGEGVEPLLAVIGAAVERSFVDVDVLLPYSEGALLDDVHTGGSIKAVEYVADGTRVLARVPGPLAGRLRPYAVAAEAQDVASAAASAVVGGSSSGVHGEDEEQDVAEGLLIAADGEVLAAEEVLGSEAVDGEGEEESIGAKRDALMAGMSM